MNRYRAGHQVAVVLACLALAGSLLGGCSKSQNLLAPVGADPAADEGSSTRGPAEEFAVRVEVRPGNVSAHRFVPWSTNKWFPLIPGTAYYYRSNTEEGVETQTVRVTKETVRIDGVRCVVVTDLVWLDGVLIERTRDYYAMDEDKNVWYFGEDTRAFDPVTGESDTEGTWRSGRDGAKAGIIMLADPDAGEFYWEEIAAGVAEDRARVVTLRGDAETGALGKFHNALKTFNDTPLEPDFSEHKYYVAGVGLALEVDLASGERNRLVRFTRSHGGSDDDDDDDDLRGPVANQK